VLTNREPGEQSAALGHEGEPVAGEQMRRAAGNRLTVHRDRPGHRLVEAGDGVKRGRLARTIGSEQSHDLAGGELDTDVADDRVPEVAGREAVDAERRRNRRGHAVSTPPFALTAP
jgi:hypothetical protein